eukprot:TRINITY_DN73190_c0_g1_i1.p1 TRINITY_DN73190_c0_g1~~TRINITY_DN73190_c0_g1_i1.p1  ORF type:complete len:305 (+),score=79.81 TRINITY_DN73190_c0_g1_i1:59-916(+)
MGPKRDRAASFSMDVSAFQVPREEAIAWLNKALDVTYEDVETLSMRGAEWCQLVHLCTTPEEGIIDLSRVYFGANLTSTEVDANYAVLLEAFSNLGVQCDYVSGDETLTHLKQGWYSQAIDLLHFMRHFCTHMGEPLYYHPKHERDEVEKVRRQRQQQVVKEAPVRANTSAANRRTAAPTRRKEAVPTRTEKRPLAASRNIPAPVPAKRRAVAPATPTPPMDLKARNSLTETREKLAQSEGLLTMLATKVDTAVSQTDKYLLSRSDVPADVRDAVMKILTSALSS